MLLPIHIIAGGAAIVLGGVALLVRKGGRLHRRAGLLFVYAMLTMGFSGAALGAARSWLDPNVFAGFLCGYFVVTALTTVRRASTSTRALDVAAIGVAGVLVCAEVVFGVRIYHSPRRVLGGVPFFMPLFLAGVLALAVYGDIRTWRAGGLRGGPRLARHLWRMCFALFIAAGSFFSIRTRVVKVLPEILATGPLRALPVALIFVALFYWLWRVRGPRGLTAAGAGVGSAT